MKTEKNKLRERIKQVLAEQNEDRHYCNFQSSKAVIKMYNFELFKEASCVLAFVSCGTEIKTNQLLEVIHKENKKLYLPRTENGNLDFYSISPCDENVEIKDVLEDGEYGISVPKKCEEKLDVNNLPEKTLIIVPGLGFDENGNRLGRGKGYYDRFLEKILLSDSKNNLLGIVGYCYDFQIVKNVITEETDVPVDFIISDIRVVNVKHNITTK
jgi:5-formyltetrahydrofolate cyclo-ligase